MGTLTRLLAWLALLAAALFLGLLLTTPGLLSYRGLDGSPFTASTGPRHAFHSLSVLLPVMVFALALAAMATARRLSAARQTAERLSAELEAARSAAEKPRASAKAPPNPPLAPPSAAAPAAASSPAAAPVTVSSPGTRAAEPAKAPDAPSETPGPQSAADKPNEDGPR